MQTFGVAQFVVRGELLISISELPLVVVGMKLRPSTASSKLCSAPAITLEGRTVSIVGPDVTATVAVAVRAEFAARAAGADRAKIRATPACAAYAPVDS